MPADPKFDRLFELFRWNPHVNPNPPDPALAIVLELAGNPALNKSVAAALVKMQVQTAHANAEFWTGIQKSIGG
jgi:hypothetical protein